MTVFEAIETQQKGKEGTAPWMVGEQLKGICRAEPASAEIVLEDLKNKDMSIEAAERKIKEYADKSHKSNRCFCVPPNVAEHIIREFYGLPEADIQASVKPQESEKSRETEMTGILLDLASFF